jgi:uncharacterized membrane protein YphA (DoxX/SURF4 family)
VLIATILAIEMLVVVFSAHHGQVFGDGEHGMLYLTGYLAIVSAWSRKGKPRWYPGKIVNPFNF